MSNLTLINLFDYKFSCFTSPLRHHGFFWNQTFHWLLSPPLSHCVFRKCLLWPGPSHVTAPRWLLWELLWESKRFVEIQPIPTKSEGVFVPDVTAATLVYRTIYSESSLGNLTLLLRKPGATLCYCFVRLITWMQRKNSPFLVVSSCIKRKLLYVYNLPPQYVTSTTKSEIYIIKRTQTIKILIYFN